MKIKSSHMGEGALAHVRSEENLPPDSLRAIIVTGWITMNSMRTIFGFVLAALASLCCAQGITTRVSVSSAGEQGNGPSGWNAGGDSAVSANGRFVAFGSGASNLVTGDTNGFYDCFVHDRETGETTRVSISSTGAQGNERSLRPSSSADGRFVAFFSYASNLVADDTNGGADVFIHDRQSGSTTRVSISSTGAQGNGSSGVPRLSADGRFVAFGSGASNLVLGDTNGQADVFVHDRQTGETTRVSVSSTGAQGNGTSGFQFGANSISTDGRFVAYFSYASTLVAGDTNGTADCFVHDRQTGQTTRVSVSSAGAQGNDHSFDPSVSSDGRFVAFWSWASNLVAGDTNGGADAFVHDRQTGQTTLVSVSSAGAQGTGESWYPSLSADARFVTFSSNASNLVPGDTNGFVDVFVHDRYTGQTARASVSSAGDQSNGDSSWSLISADGRFVAFWSTATNLVPDDTNGFGDVFVHDRLFEAVGPSSFTLFRGTVVSGNLVSLLVSDDNRLVMRPGAVFSSQEAPIQLIVNATSSNATPSRLEFSVEAHCSAANISQSIALYNFDTQAYETLNTSTATTSDSTVVVVVTSNPGRFIGRNLELRSRVAYKAQGPTFAYPWFAGVDEIKWTLTD